MIDNYIKFSIIALCFIVAIGSYRFCYSKRDWAFLAAAMGFTLASDYFLVLVHNYRAGVFVFCFVHMIYILRVSDNWEKSLMKIGATILGGWLAFVIFAFIPALPILDTLIVFAVVYAALFIQNIVAHIKLYQRDSGFPMVNRRLMLAGMILFALCDIHVLMFNLPRFIPISPAIAAWGYAWMWVFYAPSQLLLSISAVKWEG